MNSATFTQFIYGDTPADFANFNVDENTRQERDYLYGGDDLIKGGNNIKGDQYIVGGYGNDVIYSGSNNEGG